MARTELAVKALGGGKIGMRKRTSCRSEHKTQQAAMTSGSVQPSLMPPISFHFFDCEYTGHENNPR